LDKREAAEILKVLKDGVLTSASMEGGRQVRDFENLMKEYLGVREVISVNSGTSALYSSLLSCGIGIGDEVILPSFTFVATANSVVATGARPVFVDINKDDFTINLENLEKKITDKTKAVIPVHLYGHPANMGGIKDLLRKRSIYIIEDACQSLGSTYEGKQTGTIGDIGCFSLYASKVLTSGEGGFIATNDKLISNKIRMIRNHGMVKGYDTRILGMNMRLPEINAAIAKVQMKKLETMLRSRKHNANTLSKILSSIKGVNIPEEQHERMYNWYLYTISFTNNIRNKIGKVLNQKGIGAAVYYDPPVHKTPYYRNLISNLTLTNTEWASRHVLSLPVHPLLTEKELEFICSTLKEALG
jgi:dTDP-4-amino-4,6-dideoxygalactose transaminase